MTKGKLYGVGVPLGDAEYISIKALNVIKEADIIFTSNDGTEMQKISYAYESLKDVYSEIVDKEVIFIDIPKVGNYNKLINTDADTKSVIIDLLNQNMQIVYICNWSASFSYDYNYIHNIIGNKFETEIIPSPSFESICSSKLNETIASEGEDIHIITSSDDIENYLNLSGVIIFANMNKNYKIFLSVVKKMRFADIRVIDAVGSNNEKIYMSLDKLPDRLSKVNLVIWKKS